jgi:hypothetical protein
MIINNCAEYQHFNNANELDGVKYAFCWEHERMFEENDGDIPRWCRLKDAEQPKIAHDGNMHALGQESRSV